MANSAEMSSATSTSSEGVKNLNGLMIACAENDIVAVRKLLKQKKIDAADVDSTGKIALHYCAEKGSLALLKEVLAANSALVDHKDIDGYTPTNFAIIGEKPEIAKHLLSKGADPNNLDNEKHSLVHWATVCGQAEALEALLDAEALASTPDIYGAHALHYATQLSVGETAEKGKAILQLLLQNGANVNCTDNDDRTPLLWAASAGSLESAKLLVKSGADRKSVDRDRLSALHCAASRGHSEVLQYLLNSKSGLKPDAKDKNGCTPLFYAVTLGHSECVKILLENRKAQPDCQDRKLRSAAHYGASKGQLKSLQLLHEYGANMSLQNHRGDMPVHEAVQAGSKEIVRWLLEVSKSNANASNYDGRSPLHIAAATGNLDLCQTLVRSGADVNSLMLSKDDLITPLDIAVQKSHTHIMEFLRNNGGQVGADLPEDVQTKAREHLQHQQASKQESSDAENQVTKIKKKSSPHKSPTKAANHRTRNASAATSLRGSFSDWSPTSPGHLRRAGKSEASMHGTRSSKKRRKQQQDQKEKQTKEESSVSNNGSSQKEKRKSYRSQSVGTSQTSDDRESPQDGKTRRKATEAKATHKKVPPKQSPQVKINGREKGREEEDAYYDDDQDDGNEENIRPIKPRDANSRGRRGQFSPNSVPSLEIDGNSSNRSNYGAHYNVRNNIRRYMEEKRIFQELANLKRMQIQYGHVQEDVLVHRMVEDFIKGVQIQPGDFQFFTFNAWEKFLYDQLKYMYLHEQEEQQRALATHGAAAKSRKSKKKSLFDQKLKRLPVRNEDRRDQLTKIYGIAPLPLQYSPNLQKGSKNSSARLAPFK